jgi:hypothetical protein
MTLSEQEKEAKNKAFSELLDFDDYEVIFDAGFQAGLSYNQKRIEELEAKVKELSLQLSSYELQLEFKGK